MIELREVGAGDWRTWRSLRLAALADAPHAFGSVLADWQGDGDREERWRARLGLPGSRHWVAQMGGQPVGMASGVPLEPHAHVAAGVEVISMWVAPEARGLGVGAALLAAVERWAVAAGASEVRLAVAVGNERAWRLYEQHGYVDTGARQAMPDGVRREAVLAKPLR